MDFRILGSLEVRDEEGRQLALGAGRQRALLALLLLHAGEFVSSDRLIDELWGERAPPTAAKVVQNHVSQLRRALGDGRLITHGHGYVLELEPGALDFDRFESLAADGSRAMAGGDARTASAKLREALALYRGPALADFAYEPFAQAAIARLEERRLAATEERIEADLALGLDVDLVGELEELVRLHPLRERPYAQLMLALYRSGRQAEALETYRVARTALVTELGLEPGEELRELQRAILAHDPRLAAPRRVAAAISPPARVGARSRGPLRRLRLLAVIGAVLLTGGAAAAVALTRGSEGHPLVVAGDSVAIVDPGSGRVVGQVAVGSRPIAIAVGRDAVWVANADDGTVSRIDPKTRRVVATIRTAAPASDIAVGEGSVWVTNGGTGTLARIDPRTNAVVDTIELARPGKLLPEGLSSVATGAGAVWVGSGTGTVLKIDPATDELLSRIDVGMSPVDIALGGGDLWVVHVGGYVLRIDTATNTVMGAVPAAPYARAIAVGENGVWVTDAPREGGGLVWRIDPETVTVSGATTRLAHAPVGVAVGGGAVWVAGGPSGTLIRIDPRSGEVTGSIRVGDVPLAAAYGAGALWLTVAARAAPPA